jgi:hypothetical protein
MENALVKPETLGEMIANYEQALRDVNELMPYYRKAEKHLKSRYRSYDPVDFEYTLESLKIAAWNEVFHKTNLYQLMSIKESDDIQKKLWGRDCRDNEKLQIPDFTLENVLAFIDAKTADMPNMLARKILEVYDILRPYQSWNKKLKTNDKSLGQGIGSKVILGYYFDHIYGDGRMRINYQKQAEINAIQEVFWMLDGKGVPHDGEKLYHKLYESTRADAFEDDYFRIKGYSNGNMHLEFKRMDLVAKIMATVKEKAFSKVA